MTTPLSIFRAWAQTAQFGADFVYHDPMHGERRPELFDYARKLQHAGLVMLHQAPSFTDPEGVRTFKHCARRTPVLAHVALDELSRTIPAPPRKVDPRGRPEL